MQKSQAHGANGRTTFDSVTRWSSSLAWKKSDLLPALSSNMDLEGSVRRVLHTKVCEKCCYCLSEEGMLPEMYFWLCEQPVGFGHCWLGVARVLTIHLFQLCLGDTGFDVADVDDHSSHEVEVSVGSHMVICLTI